MMLHGRSSCLGSVFRWRHWKCLHSKAPGGLVTIIPSIPLADLAVVLWLTGSQLQGDTWEGLVRKMVLRLSSL